ncbi:ABC transporter permease subunit [Nocardioides sp. TF02-7]|uniref:ABC transporter permease n=1 Tax=Nocardioides sp. TF02-7 TaxID=2917724 RepID=UPI001F065BAC|nr:ABC transporter permease subunit [Nocardioides sp. TF02-7]UMG93915.1 ABC transporter permease subunit [Nocardioides sp. TF02-7]
MDRPHLRVTGGGSAGTGRLLGLLGLAAVPTAVLGLFFLLPVAGMLERGLWPEGSFEPGAVLEVLGTDRTRRVVWFTVWTSSVATAASVLLGLPAAYVLHRLRFPLRGAVRAALLVPFVLPTVVVGIAVRELVADSGPLGFLGLDGTPVAILIGLVFFNVAVVIRTVGAAWEGLDRRPAEAAAALGAAPWQVLVTVTLPALRPAIVSAASVVFLFCATGFGVVLTLGGVRYASVETEIYLLTTGAITGSVELGAAAALSIVQLVAVVALLGVAARLRAVPDPTVRRSVAAPTRPRRRDLPALFVTGGVLAAVALPIATLVVGSLRRDGAWTLVHYRALTGVGADAGGNGGGLLRAPVTEALGNSLRIAVDATWMSLLLGLLVAVVVTSRSRSAAERRVRSAFDGLFMLPLGVSAVTLGFGFLITLDEPPLDLRSSPLLVPVAQALVALPLVVRVLVPVLQGIDDRQRQAAASLGAGPLRSLLTVDVPVLWRPLLVAAGFAFAVSLGEFGATSFIVRADVPTLPVVIYRLIGSPGQLNYGTALAASVVLAAVTALVVLLVERLRVPGAGTF